MSTTKTYSYAGSYAVDTALADCDEILYDGRAMRIINPASSGLTTFSVYESHDGTNYVRSQKDVSGTLTDITLSLAAGKACELPGELFAAKSIKLVANAEGTIHAVQKC